MIGTTLGHYKILDLLGAGGMGEVYRAEDTTLGRQVALKMLTSAFTTDAERLARFEREAKVLAALDHPNIAAIYSFEKANSVHFLVMQLAEGETLAEVISRGPLPLEEALPVASQIALALAAAHDKGIIHRDLKPGNVKVDREGRVKVLDFGLAKALGSTSENPIDLSESPTLTAEMTVPGVLLGTAAYMSPEQARGKPVDRQADIWAFGIVLYELLTGSQPFAGETVTDYLAKILEREPDWQILPQETPKSVRTLLYRCLAKDPQRRLRDMGDVWLELEESEGASLSAAADGTRPTATSRIGLKALLWLLGPVAGALGLWILTPGETTTGDRPVRFTLPTPPLALRAGTSPLTVSPDGRRLAYVAQQDGVRHIYLRDLGQSDAVRIEGTANGQEPFFSPDGQWLGFFADNKMKKVLLRGGPAQVICDSAWGTLGAHWTTDDTIVFNDYSVEEGAGAGVWRVPAAGGVPEPLISPRLDEGEWTVKSPEVMPGGEHIVFIGMDGSCSTQEIAVYSLATGERQTLVEGGSQAQLAASGHLVYSEGASILAAPFDLERLEVTGSPVTVLDHVRSPGCGESNFSLSENGTLAYIAGEGQPEKQNRVVWVDREGDASPLPNLEGKIFMGPRLSPSSNRIALWNLGGNPQVWLYEIDRSILIPLTTEGQNFWSHWSPDGQHLAFASLRTDIRGLFWKAADGSGRAEPLLATEFVDQPMAWSPDGQQIVFHRSLRPETGWDIWVLPIAQPRQPSPFLAAPYNEYQPALSPDGRWLAYVSNESGRDEIYLTTFPTPSGKWRASTEGGTEPLWNPSGEELFYRDNRAVMAVRLTTEPDLRLENARKLFEGNYFEAPTYGRNYDVTPDGQRFLMTMPVETEAPSTEIHIVLNWFDELERLVPTSGS